MKTQHTPAPWRNDGNTLCAANGRAILAIDAIGGETEGEVTGNIALIAAAPELLTALKAVMATLQRKTAWDDAKIIIVMAERIIKKAEGN